MSGFRAWGSVCVAMILICASGVQADIFGEGTNQFTIDFVPIAGDAGDLGSWPAGQNYTFSGVDRSAYRMGTFEITNDQWDKFTNSLGVPVAGAPPYAYDEESYYAGTNVPTNNVCWYEAAQFVNWLNTSKGYQAAYKFTGTQGQGDYALDTWSPAEAYGGTNLFRHKDAMYYMPTEDEWIKAAYWNGTSLQTWATGDDSVPVSGIDSNCDDVIGEPWDVGSGSEELNSTYDMMGNIAEWMESPHWSGYYVTDTHRMLRGGVCNLSYVRLQSSYREMSGTSPTTDSGYIGFRVAANVPEPSSLAMLSLGGLILMKRRRS